MAAKKLCTKVALSKSVLDARIRVAPATRVCLYENHNDISSMTLSAFRYDTGKSRSLISGF